VSSYSIAPDGSLDLVEAVAGDTGTGPTDAALSRTSGFLYVLDSADGTIGAFEVQSNGGLVAIAGAGGLPGGSTTGIAAR
jgi:hypothetical protein